jgi:hypothetical protein
MTDEPLRADVNLVLVQGLEESFLFQFVEDARIDETAWIGGFGCGNSVHAFENGFHALE